MERFLRTLSFVPEDKTTWSPAPTAKNALQIAAHTAVTAGFFAQLIRDGKFPSGDMQEMFGAMAAAEAAVTNRQAAIDLLKKNTDAIVAALDAATPELIGKMLPTPFGSEMPMAFFMNLPGVHAQVHGSQIDYLQTCWGDMDPHMG